MANSRLILVGFQRISVIQLILTHLRRRYLGKNLELLTIDSDEFHNRKGNIELMVTLETMRYSYTRPCTYPRLERNEATGKQEKGSMTGGDCSSRGYLRSGDCLNGLV